MTLKQASIMVPAEHREERIAISRADARGDRNAQIAVVRRRLGERVKSTQSAPSRSVPGTDAKCQRAVVRTPNGAASTVDFKLALTRCRGSWRRTAGAFGALDKTATRSACSSFNQNARPQCA